MRYEVRNIYFGTKMIIPSEAALDNFLSTCKKDKRLNKPVWEMVKELPDAEPRPVKFTKEELMSMMAELDDAKSEVDSTTERTVRRGRPPANKEE